jgi:hypothetical protein
MRGKRPRTEIDGGEKVGRRVSLLDIGAADKEVLEICGLQRVLGPTS